MNKLVTIWFFSIFGLSSYSQTKITINRSILTLPYTIQLAENYLDSNKVSEATWILINSLEENPAQAESLAKRIKEGKTDKEFIQLVEDIFWAYILQVDLVSTNEKNRVFEDYFFLETQLIAFATQHGMEALQLDEQAQKQMAEGKKTEAVQSYTTAIQLIPTARRYYRRAELYEALNETRKALQDYDSSILLKPVPIHYLSRGELYMDLRSLDDAIRDFNVVINSKFEYLLHDAYFNRALCYALKGNLNSDKKSIELSIPDFTKAIEIYPTADAYKRRALSYYTTENREAGKKDLMMAIELNPNDPESYFFLGGFENDFRKDNFEKRIAWLTKCIELIQSDNDPTNLRRDAIGLRGVIYYDNGKKKQACADFQQAMVLGDIESEKYYNKYCRKRK
jgi:tetratricopeptide (TPR) repeat protein